MKLIFLCLCTVIPVRAVVDDRIGLDLTEFPTDVSADITTLWVDHNVIDHVPPEALQGLPVLYDISIGVNHLTGFPNLTAVADSLEILDAHRNNIAFVDRALVEALYKLKELYLDDNDLELFPTLTSGSCNSLSVVDLSENPLVSTPSFLHYMVLSWLWIGDTPISQVPPIGEDVTLMELAMQETDITEVPVMFMSRISVQELSLEGSPVAFLPSPCVTDLSALVVSAESTPLPVCECRHVWLKAATEMGSVIDVDDPDCSGNLWSTSSVEELLDACWATPDAVTTGNARRLFSGFFCHFPLHSTLSDVTVLKCLSVCLITPACFSFNFLDLGGKGDCVILAPGGNLDLNVPDVASPDWSYFMYVTF